MSADSVPLFSVSMFIVFLTVSLVFLSYVSFVKVCECAIILAYMFAFFTAYRFIIEICEQLEYRY